MQRAPDKCLNKIYVNEPISDELYIYIVETMFIKYEVMND